MHFQKQFYEEGYSKGQSEFKDKIERYRCTKVIEQFHRYVKIKPESVLDIGCGTGILLSTINSSNKSGIDISTTAITKARQKGFDAHPCNIEEDKFPFKDKQFDVIFCMEVFEHLYTEQNAMSEIKRVLKPSGYLYITVPNDVLRLHKRIGVLFGRPFRPRRPFKDPHIRFFCSKELGNLVEEYGFKIIYNGALPLSYHTFSLGGIGRFLSDHFTDLFPNNYSIICQKVEQCQN